MATTIENFLLRFKTEGADKINSAREGVRGLSDDVIAANANLGVLSGSFSRVIGGLGTVGLAAVAGGAAFASLGLKAINIADAFSDLSDATGISASAIMSFKQSVIDAGGDSDDYQKILAKLNQSVQDAATGNVNLQDAFKKMGVYVRDAGGNVRSTEDIFNDLLQRFREGGVSAAEFSAAVDLMGKNVNRLDLTKLRAINDPFKDEQIKQLATYRTAIDSLVASVENSLITVFGKLAIKIKEAQDQAAKMQAEANKEGNIRTMDPRTGIFITRPMTAKEKSAYTDEQQRRRDAEEKAKVDASKGNANKPAGIGDYGAANAAKAKAEAEAAARALAASQDRIEQSRLAARFDSLRQNLDDMEALELDRAEALARAKLQIQNQENLSKAQKALELAAKNEEINADFDKRIRDYNKREADKQLEEEKRRIEKINQARQQAGDIVDEAKKQNQIANERFALEQKVLGMREVDRQYTVDQNNLLQEQKNQLEAIRALKDLPEDQRLLREQEITAEYEKQRVALEQQRLARVATQNDPTKGAQSVIARMMDATTPFQVAADQTASVFDNMNSALDKFVETGKFKFGDFARSVIQDLIKIQLKAQATQLLSMAFGAFGINLPTIQPRAAGGPVNAGSPYLVGERGPELFMPRQAGSIVPNGQLSAMGTNSTNVTYNIQAADAASFRQMLARDPEFLYNLTEQTRKSMPARRRQ